MRSAVIHARGAQYEISANALLGAPAEGGFRLSFEETESALAFLRGLARETGVLVELRGLLRAVSGAAGGPRDDDDVLRDLARLLHRGSVAAWRRKLPRLASWGGEEEETAPASVRSFRPIEERRWVASIDDEEPPRWVASIDDEEPPRWAASIDDEEPPAAVVPSRAAGADGATAAH